MTKIRSTRQLRCIDDRRGQSGGGAAASPGLRRRWVPVPDEGRRRRCSASSCWSRRCSCRSCSVRRPVRCRRRRNPSTGRRTTGGACVTELEQVVCGVTNDVQDVLGRPTARVLRHAVPGRPRPCCSPAASSTGCGQASIADRAVLLPGRPPRLHRPRVPAAAREQLIGTATDLAEQYILAHEYGHHVQNLLGTNAQVQQAQQNDPGRANQYSVALELQADCFAGVWVGDVASRGLLDIAERDRRGHRRRRGCRRRSHPAEDAGSHRPGELDARFGRAAPVVVHARLQHRATRTSATRSPRCC